LLPESSLAQTTFVPSRKAESQLPLGGTSRKLSRIADDRAHERQWRAKSQSRKALPKRIAVWEKTRDELRKEAKGLK
jgi:hypothetical protein